jgi:energy-coupling factor transport system ATP-binding protein
VIHKVVTLISFQSVSFTYPRAGAPALRDLTLDVRDGETLAVVGANGSGKSTMGRLTNGLLVPGQGTVLVDGVATSVAGGQREARQRVGMVFQNPDSGIVSSSVEEDVAFALENRAAPRQVIVEKVARTLDLLGLRALHDAHPLSLTTSDRARLGLASAVVGDPRYLIMDEATAYLDATDRALLMQAVQTVRAATGMAVVIITHLMDEALAADRVAVLADGELVYLGAPRELFADPGRARAWRLELPPLLALRDDLRGLGVDVGPVATSIDALVEQLCHL